MLRLPPDKPNEEGWGQQRKMINLPTAFGPLGPTAPSKAHAPGRGGGDTIVRRKRGL